MQIVLDGTARSREVDVARARPLGDQGRDRASGEARDLRPRSPGCTGLEERSFDVAGRRGSHEWACGSGEEEVILDRQGVYGGSQYTTEFAGPAPGAVLGTKFDGVVTKGGRHCEDAKANWSSWRLFAIADNRNQQRVIDYLSSTLDFTRISTRIRPPAGEELEQGRLSCESARLPNRKAVDASILFRENVAQQIC